MKKHLLFFVPAVFLCLLGICFGDVIQDKCAALFEAVKKDDLQQVLKLLDQGADVNCRGEYQYTPLITAARYNCLEIAEALIDRGADVKTTAGCDFVTNEWGYTPLLWAVRNGSPLMVRLLLDKGALVGKQGRGEEDVPLVLAARGGDLGHIEVAKVLLEKGAAVDEVLDENQDTALITAVRWGHLDMAEYLIGKGADINKKADSGSSLFRLSVARGYLAEVMYFHDKGFPMNEMNRLGEGPIFDALSDDVESRYVLEYLIAHGAKATEKTARGYTPIMSAAERGSAESIRILIANGAVVRDSDEYGATPLHYACRGMCDYYREEPGKWEKTIGLLIENGADVNAANSCGVTPLMHAADTDATRIVEMLIEHGASVDRQTKEGATALMFAAYADQPDVIKALVKHGADLNIRDQAGETALTAARKRGKHASRAAELLKSLGAKE